MSTKKSEIRKDMEVVKSVLDREWDPLNVKGQPGGASEYDSSIPNVLRFAAARRTTELVAYLTSVERNEFQIEPDIKRNEEVAALLIGQIAGLQDRK